MVENAYGNFNYTVDFIENLQTEISIKLANVVNKENISRKNDLGIVINMDDVTKLSIYQDILTQVVNCNSCFEGYKIEDVVEKTKTLLNRL